VTKYQQLSDALKRWWKQQTKWKNYKSLSRDCGIPVGTFKKYLYGIKQPGQKYREKLYSITNLEILRPPSAEVALPRVSKPYRPTLGKKRFIYALRTLERLNQEIARVLGSLPPAMEGLMEMSEGVSRDWIISAQTVQLVMDAMERSLRPFLKSDEGLQILRKQLSGGDAGYLSGLLSSIFDDKRLSNWKDMTTYRYGSKQNGSRLR
jgi:hypothetical protein